MICLMILALTNNKEEREEYDVKKEKAVNNAEKLVFVFTVCSIVFAIFIHILFKIKTGPEWLRAEWEAGDILTYTSTVALGLLALWQNKRFKEENDASQVRLEKLTEQANNIIIVNKIVERESNKVEHLKVLLDSFAKACDPANAISLFSKDCTNEQSRVDMLAKAYIARESIIYNLNTICLELGIDRNSRLEDLPSFPRAVLEYGQESGKSIMMLAEDLNSISDEEITEAWIHEDTRNHAEEVYNLQKTFFEARELFLRKREALIDKILFGNYSIDEIKKMVEEEDSLLDG